MGIFDDLIQSGFWVIPKTTFANLCKPIHETIIPVSPEPSNLKTVERSKKNAKSEYLKNEKSFLDEINFWNAFFW